MEVLRLAGCNPVVVVCPASHLDRAAQLSEGDEGFVFVEGGATRRASVAAGLAAVERPTVVVHDGARPFVTTEMVTAVLEALETYDGATVAVPMDETLKRVEDGAVVATVDRTSLWRVQTPQAFRTDVLKAAHAAAASDDVEATDDAALVERFGGSIGVIRGSRANIKITYPEDLALAASLAGDRP